MRWGEVREMSSRTSHGFDPRRDPFFFIFIKKFILFYFFSMSF